MWWGWVCVGAGASEVQKVRDPLELELQAVVWVMGAKPRFSACVTQALNHWTISPAPLSPLIRVSLNLLLSPLSLPVWRETLIMSYLSF